MPGGNNPCRPTEGCCSGRIRDDTEPMDDEVPDPTGQCRPCLLGLHRDDVGVCWKIGAEAFVGGCANEQCSGLTQGAVLKVRDAPGLGNRQTAGRKQNGLPSLGVGPLSQQPSQQKASSVPPGQGHNQRSRSRLDGVISTKASLCDFVAGVSTPLLTLLRPGWFAPCPHVPASDGNTRRGNRSLRISTREIGNRCVDIFSRPDGTYGFEEHRRVPKTWVRGLRSATTRVANTNGDRSIAAAKSSVSPAWSTLGSLSDSSNQITATKWGTQRG